MASSTFRARSYVSAVKNIFYTGQYSSMNGWFHSSWLEGSFFVSTRMEHSKTQIFFIYTHIRVKGVNNIHCQIKLLVLTSPEVTDKTNNTDL